MPASEHDPAGETLDRVRMPLLTLISRQSLDEDYLAAAQRRASQGEAAGGPPDPRRPLVAAVVLVFGLLLAVAAVQTTRDAGVRDASRASLVERLEQQRARVTDQQRLLADLREATTTAEQGLVDLAGLEQASASRLLRLQVRTGFVPVTGPGVRATLDSVAGADEDQVVRDSDLALLVNALWSAGAEAVAVNGQRLTALSAIRTSGTAVEVNGVGIAPPYTVAAIGDPDTLQARFYDTSSGLAFDDLARTYSFVFTLDNADSLTLPAAPPRLQRLRSASTGVGDDTVPRNDPELDRAG